MKFVREASTPFSGCTLTRPTRATAINEVGEFDRYSPNKIRFNHDMQTGLFQTVLIETERWNAATYTSKSETDWYPKYLTGTKSVDITGLSVKAVDSGLTLSSGQGFVISFYGTGRVEIEGSNTNIVLDGSDEKVRTHYVHYPESEETTDRLFSLTFSGSVYALNFEPFGFANKPTADQINAVQPSSWIPTRGSPQLRAADELSGYGIIHSDFYDKHPQFSAESAYDTGDKVVYQYYVYESLQDGNSDLPTASSWLKIGASNRYAMFDKLTDTQSTQRVGVEGDISREGCVVAIRSETRSDAVAAIGVTASSEVIEAKPVLTMSSYASDRAGGILPRVKTNGYIEDGLWTSSADQTIIDKADKADIFCIHVTTQEQENVGAYEPIDSNAIVGIAEVIIGNAVSVGRTQVGMAGSLLDYSVKEKDPDFGFLKYVEKGFSLKLVADVVVETKDFNQTMRDVTSARGPRLWISTDDEAYSELGTIYGFIREFEPRVPHKGFTEYRIDIEGLLL